MLAVTRKLDSAKSQCSLGPLLTFQKTSAYTGSMSKLWRMSCAAAAEGTALLVAAGISVHIEDCSSAS